MIEKKTVIRFNEKGLSEVLAAYYGLKLDTVSITIRGTSDERTSATFYSIELQGEEIKQTEKASEFTIRN